MTQGLDDPDDRPSLLTAQRAAFDVRTGVAYFNTANLSPMLHAVRAAGNKALERRSRPWTITAQDWFDDVEKVRRLFARLVGGEPDGVAMIPATSYGFPIAARNLRVSRGERIVLLAEEYPSGVYTWQALARRTGAEIVTVRRDQGQTWTEAILAELDERVCVVSVPSVHWTDGALIDLPAVAARTHELGARLVIDASQSLGAMPLNITQLRPDFVVTVGYKWLLGPFGIGYLYVAEEHRHGEPLEENWIFRAGSEDFARLVDYRDDYQPGSRRFDVGERTKFELMPMAAAALSQLLAWQIPNVAATLAAITDRIAAAATDTGLHPLPAEHRGPHLLGIGLPQSRREQVLNTLAEADCFAAGRSGSLRIAPHLHITEHDEQVLLSALTKAVQRSGLA